MFNYIIINTETGTSIKVEDSAECAAGVEKSMVEFMETTGEIMVSCGVIVVRSLFGIETSEPEKVEKIELDMGYLAESFLTHIALEDDDNYTIYVTKSGGIETRVDGDASSGDVRVFDYAGSDIFNSIYLHNLSLEKVKDYLLENMLNRDKFTLINYEVK